MVHLSHTASYLPVGALQSLEVGPATIFFTSICGRLKLLLSDT